MALESDTFINSLNSSNPVASDGLAFADDHMRLIKATILASFPNITDAMTATHTVLNGIDARVTAIESGVHASGTKILFAQTDGPKMWTKDTTNNNDSAIRVVTGTAGTGGTNALSTRDATASGTINTSASGTTDATGITIAEIPSHTHAPPTTISRVQVGFDNGTSYAFKSDSNTHGGITMSNERTNTSVNSFISIKTLFPAILL